MPGLMLKLRPFEAVMVNGAMIENGKRESRIRIASENVNILRMREALMPHEVTSPLAEAYYAAQLAVVGAIDGTKARSRVSEALAQHLNGDSDDAICSDAIAAAKRALADGAFYQVMRAIGPAVRGEGAQG
ncbi:MAG: flagellar biosynthesis repressor FlbT [Pseudomonadota bacterium]